MTVYYRDAPLGFLQTLWEFSVTLYYASLYKYVWQTSNMLHMYVNSSVGYNVANNSYLVFPIYILCHHLCYHLFVHSDYSPHCTSRKSYVCHVLFRAVWALHCLRIGWWSGDKGRTVYGQIYVWLRLVASGMWNADRRP